MNEPLPKIFSSLGEQTRTNGSSSNSLSWMSACKAKKAKSSIINQVSAATEKKQIMVQGKNLIGQNNLFIVVIFLLINSYLHLSKK